MHADEHGQAGHGHDGQEWGAYGHGAHASSLDLGEEERLPWLESAEDVDGEGDAGGHHRLIALAIVALIVLGLLIGAIYWLTHRQGPVQPADGSVIEASQDPYKIAPEDPGGKKFAGTGDTSFKVSQGEHTDANLAGSGGTGSGGTGSGGTGTGEAGSGTKAAAKPTAAARDAGHAGAAPAAHATDGKVAVQVGAFSNAATAETAWARLVKAHDVLDGLGHRVVEGKADIGTVYRLQALAAGNGAANSLCARLESAGVKCQVKH